MTQHDKAKGAWVVVSADDTFIESGELAALRTAVSTGGTVQFVKYGDAVGAAPTEAAKPASKPAVPAPKTEEAGAPAY